MTDKKQIPEFKSPEEEREFWDKTDITELEPDSIEDAHDFAPGPRPPMTTFALRIAAKDIDRARVIAEARGGGVSQLMRAWILEGLRRAEGGKPSLDDILADLVMDNAPQIADILRPALDALLTKHATTGRRSLRFESGEIVADLVATEEEDAR